MDKKVTFGVVSVLALAVLAFLVFDSQPEPLPVVTEAVTSAEVTDVSSPVDAGVSVSGEVSVSGDVSVSGKVSGSGSGSGSVEEVTQPVTQPVAH